MAKKKFDRDKTYSIKWKSDDDKNHYWIHMHCRLVACGAPGIIPNYRKSCYDVYQLMSLYDDVDRFGTAYGGWLNEIQDISPEAIKYLQIKELTGGDRDDCQGIS